MFRFVTTDAESIANKRKSVPRACESCRSRKKRCVHGAGGSPPSTPSPTQPARLTPRLRTTSQVISQDRSTGEDVAIGRPPSRIVMRSPRCQNDESPANREPDGQVPQQDHPRFVGDLAPEGAFLAVDREVDQPIGSDVGIWLRDKEPGIGSSGPRSHLVMMLEPEGAAVTRRLKERCLATLPPDAEAKELFRCYSDRYHPILPIVDHLDPSQRSSVPTLLLQGLYLVASMHPSMKQNLRLRPDGHLLSHRMFGKHVWSAMKTAIELDLETDKVVLLQASVLMWMFQDGPNAIEASSTVCARAVQYVHSLGFHLARDRYAVADRHKDSILLCVWAIDRLNAACHGRPVLMHERDLGLNLADCIASQPPCARLFFRVILWLDEVIQLYRPKALYRGDQGEAETTIPRKTFEALIIECGAIQVPSHLIETIEIMYCATAILSDRPQNFSTGSRQTFLQSQREQTAQCVVLSVSKDTASHRFSYLPFIPYAVSLSMSVDYAALRQTRIPMYRDRARGRLKADCSLLEQLSITFGTARAMVEACKKALNEYDRVTAEMTERTDTRDGSRMNDDGVQTVPDDAGEVSINLDDIDIFQFFDPNIGLDHLDAQFAGNLNPFEPFCFDNSLLQAPL